jgi:hypothetical protein
VTSVTGCKGDGGEWYNHLMTSFKWDALWVGVFINIVFWSMYTTTDNLVVSIGITAVVAISFTGVLYKLGQINKRRQRGWYIEKG